MPINGVSGATRDPYDHGGDGDAPSFASAARLSHRTAYRLADPGHGFGRPPGEDGRIQAAYLPLTAASGQTGARQARAASPSESSTGSSTPHLYGNVPGLSLSYADLGVLVRSLHHAAYPTLRLGPPPSRPSGVAAWFPGGGLNGMTPQAAMRNMAATHARLVQLGLAPDIGPSGWSQTVWSSITPRGAGILLEKIHARIRPGDDVWNRSLTISGPGVPDAMVVAVYNRLCLLAFPDSGLEPPASQGVQAAVLPQNQEPGPRI